MSTKTIPSRGGNPYLPHSLRDGTATKSAYRSAPPAQTIGGVPVGTSVQIQEWVGDDPDRAARALARERESERPRITLVANLETIIRRSGGTPKAELPSAPVPALALPSVVEESVAPQPETVIIVSEPITSSGPITVSESIPMSDDQVLLTGEERPG